MITSLRAVGILYTGGMKLARAFSVSVAVLAVFGGISFAHAYSASHSGTVAWSQTTGGATVFPACGSAQSTATCSGTAGQAQANVSWTLSPYIGNCAYSWLYLNGVMVFGSVRGDCSDSYTIYGLTPSQAYSCNLQEADANGLTVDNNDCSFTTPGPCGGGNCHSAPNACGQVNYGTRGPLGRCRVSIPPNPPGYGNPCQSAPNACGQTSGGTIQCNGSCSAITPSNTSCPPDLTAGATSVSPVPVYVGAGETFSANVSNIGAGPATNFPNIFQLADGAITQTLAMIGAQNLSLASGASSGISAGYTFGSSGNYNVRACANFNTSWGGSVPESNMSNNCGAWTPISVAYPPPTATLTGTPSTIDAGQSCILAWSSTHATSCTGTGFSTGGQTGGSVSSGALSQTSTYQVTCTGPGGSASSQATCTVLVPDVSITVNPERVVAGGSTTVSWSAQNVNSCTITRNGSAWKSLTADANRTVSGSVQDTITTQTVYAATCANNASGAAASATATANITSGFQEF